MIVTATNGRIGSIECDKISFCNGQASLWLEDENRKGVFYVFKKLSVTEIAWILDHSSFKNKED